VESSHRRLVSWDEIYDRLRFVPGGRPYGLPIAASVLAGMTGRAAASVDEADWILCDHDGNALSRDLHHQSKPIWAFLEEPLAPGERLVFPWESTEVRTQETELVMLGTRLLEALGYARIDGDLAQTPVRWARWWIEFLSHDAGETEASFALTTSSHIVAITQMRAWSVCEHHLLPFLVEASVAYIPTGRVVGLSKFARLLHRASHKLQLQERLAEEFADSIQSLSQTPDVGVYLRGRHLCLESRGAQTPAVTACLVARGRFETNEGLRSELLRLAELDHRQIGLETDGLPVVGVRPCS
jgi:GTP cyclohydrolase IA